VEIWLFLSLEGVRGKDFSTRGSIPGGFSSVFIGRVIFSGFALNRLVRLLFLVDLAGSDAAGGLSFQFKFLSVFEEGSIS
jgi:hypothetical protein